jgi:hypothetical protein
MRGRRTTLVQVLVAVLATAVTGACDIGPAADIEPSPGPTLVAVDPVGGDPPELRRELAVELGTAVAVYSRGCRPRTVMQRCSPNGTQTYTLASRLHEATVVGAWMQVDTGEGQWAVRIRLRTGDARAVAAVSRQTDREGGLTVVIDAGSGDVLVAIPSPGFQGSTITRRDLQKPAAQAVIHDFVTAATQR